MQRVAAFEFHIELASGSTDWVRLQGSGGLIGAGCLSDLSTRTGADLEAALARVIAQSLKRAVTEASMYGAVRVVREHPEPAERITVTPVRAVLACRPLWERTA